MEQKYVVIPSHKARKVLMHLPPQFTEGLLSSKDMNRPSYQAAIHSVTNFIITASLDTSGEDVEWLPVSGQLIHRNLKFFLEFGWKFGDMVVLFSFSELEEALMWLKMHGFIWTQANGLEKGETYLPTPRLAAEFAKMVK